MDPASIPNQIPFENTSLADALDCNSTAHKATGGCSKDLLQISDSEWTVAACRHKSLQPLLIFGNPPKDEVRRTAIHLNVNVSTVYRWLARLKTSNQVSVLLRGKRGMKTGHILIDAAIEEIIRQEIEQSYLTNLQLSAKAVTRHIFLRCRDRGYKLPSEGTVRTRIRRLAPGMVAERRTNQYAARQRFQPKVGHISGAEYPYALIEIDHTPLDLVLVDDIHRQPIGRPYLTLAIDVFSRTVAGFHLALEAPGSTSVAVCLAHAILPKDIWCMERKLTNSWPVHGLMDCVHCDNGREFHSRALERACQQYGMRLQHRPVRQPHYGAHIERLLGTFATEIHNVPGTTKSNPAERGDYDSEKHACLTLKECECWLAEFITGVYHQRIHSALGVPPIVKYQEAIAAGETQSRRGRLDLTGTDPVRLWLDFMPFFERVVQPTGIHIDGIDYYHDVLRAWIAARDPANPAAHRKFIIRRDPRDISRVYFYDPELEQYFEIPYRDRTRPVLSLWELRAAQQSLREQGRQHTDQDAVFDSIERLRQKQEEASERTRRARREAQRRRLNGGMETQSTQTQPAPDPGFMDPPPQPFADIGDTLE